MKLFNVMHSIFYVLCSIHTVADRRNQLVNSRDFLLRRGILQSDCKPLYRSMKDFDIFIPFTKSPFLKFLMTNILWRIVPVAKRASRQAQDMVNKIPYFLLH